MDAQGHGRIVAAVDGSPATAGVLAWARREAELRKSKLCAVMAWDVPSYAPYAVAAVTVAADGYREHAAQVFRQVMIEAIGRDFADVVECRLKFGNPAQVLVDESATADLLVMGSRGHGSFVGTFLGSISQQVCAHAHCPVVVIRKEVASEVLDLTTTHTAVM